MFTGYLLQIVCSFIADCLQVICRFYACMDPYPDFFPVILCRFYFISSGRTEKVSKQILILLLGRIHKNDGDGGEEVLRKKSEGSERKEKVRTSQ